MTLQRLVLDYRSGELVMRVLYRSEADTNPGTVRRASVMGPGCASLQGRTAAKLPSPRSAWCT
jgi:hypothetical protein